MSQSVGETPTVGLFVHPALTKGDLRTGITNHNHGLICVTLVHLPQRPPSSVVHYNIVLCTFHLTPPSSNINWCVCFTGTRCETLFK